MVLLQQKPCLCRKLPERKEKLYLRTATKLGVKCENKANYNLDVKNVFDHFLIPLTKSEMFF